MAGMVGAMVAIMGLIAVMWALSQLTHHDPTDPARTVSYSAALAEARQQSPFPVVAPEPVPPGLRATSVSWDGVGARKSWHLGFLTSHQEYVGLYEGTGPAADFVSASTPATHRGADVDIDGSSWQTLTGSGGSETAFVRTTGGVTTVVTGTADVELLKGFVASLR